MLFHFTNVDSATRIILGRQFRFTFSGELDDPFERKRNRSFSGHGNDFSLNDIFTKLNVSFEKLVNSTSIACFFDDRDVAESPVYPLLDLKMWSHYGNWHKGCCLVFKKENLIDRFEKNTTALIKKAWTCHLHQ